eukprot:4170493-Pyramimonas_sp.AAC.1
MPLVFFTFGRVLNLLARVRGSRDAGVSDLQAFYKAAKLRFDDDADFKKRAQEAVVRLQV